MNSQPVPTHIAEKQFFCFQETRFPMLQRRSIVKKKKINGFFFFSLVHTCRTTSQFDHLQGASGQADMLALQAFKVIGSESLNPSSLLPPRARMLNR